MNKVKEFLVEKSGTLCNIFCIISFLLIVFGYGFNLVDTSNIIYFICFIGSVSFQIIFFVIESIKDKKRVIKIMGIKIPLDIIIITIIFIVVMAIYYLFIK